MSALVKRSHGSLVKGDRGGDFGAALHAEWTKFRTVRGWLIALLFAAAMVVLFTFLQARGKQTGYCATPNPSSCVAGHPYVPTGPDGEAVADTYELVYKRLSGDETITARITSLTGRVWAGPANEAPSLADTRPELASWAKAGLLVTGSTRQGSAYAAVMATGGHGLHFQYDYSHDQPGRPGQVSGTEPRWLRLTRNGETITGYDSSNGTSWQRIGSAQLAGLPGTVDIGLFTTSPQTTAGLATQATAYFDQVAIGPLADGDARAPRGPWQGASIGTGAHDFYTTLGSDGYRRAGGSMVVTGSGDIAPAVTAGGDTVSDSLLFGMVVALIVLIVVATMFITSEYRRGLIRTTFAATPDRGRVLAAKAVVIGGVAFVVGAVASAAAIPLGEHMMSANGNYIYPAGPLTIAQVIAGSGALLALTAVALLGVGTIMRRSAGAILIGVVVFVLPTFTGPGVLGPTSTSYGNAAAWLFRVTPAAGFSVLGLLPRSGLVSYQYTMNNGYYPLPPWAGLLVLCAYALVALYGARIVLRRRDA
jgi:ABC-type transport system involved in multi-copper enzyme maturation permease subunit